MGKYHNKLDKKYFNKSVYAKKFEETFNIRLKDYPLQYEILFDTYNVVIGVNNILFSLNYLPNNVPIMLTVFIVGAIITFIFADKELKAMKEYNNNFWLSFIRFIMASGFSITILGSKTTLNGFIGLLGFIALLPITYRFIKKQFNFNVPKWLQVVLPIAFILIYSYV